MVTYLLGVDGLVGEKSPKNVMSFAVMEVGIHFSGATKKRVNGHLKN